MFRLICLVHLVGFKIEVTLYGVSHRARNRQIRPYLVMVNFFFNFVLYQGGKVEFVGGGWRGGGGNGRELCGLSYLLMDHCKLYFGLVECEL